MLGCLPALLPDELVHSAIAAWKDRLSLPHRIVLKLAFGEKAYRSIYDLPHHLSFFISQLPPFYPITLKHLINNHTLYPYYATVLSSDKRQQLWKLMCGDNRSLVYLIAGLSHSLIHQTHQLYYCPSCIESDKNTYGRPYWHRLHQIPGVLVCPRHNVFLEASGIYLDSQLGSNSYKFFSTKYIQVKSTQKQVDLSDSYHLRLIRLSQNTAYLLNTENIYFEPNQTANKYRSLLSRRNLPIYRYTKSTKFINKLLEYYSVEFMEKVTRTQQFYRCTSWPNRIVRGNYDSMHPLCHLLIIEFLGSSVKDFIQL